MARSRFMTTLEIVSMLSASGKRKFYYDASTGKIPVTRNPSGWGFSVTRKDFAAWLEANPQCRAEQSEAAEVLS